MGPRADKRRRVLGMMVLGCVCLGAILWPRQGEHAEPTGVVEPEVGADLHRISLTSDNLTRPTTFVSAAVLDAIIKRGESAAEGTGHLVPRVGPDEFARRLAVAQNDAPATEEELARDFTVVISLRDTNGFLSECIKAVLAYTPVGVRIIMVYSQPMAPRQMRAIEEAKSARASFEAHEILTHFANANLMRQYGADIATTPLVAFANSDTLPGEGWLSAFHLAAKYNPDYKVFVSYLLNVFDDDPSSIRTRHEATSGMIDGVYPINASHVGTRSDGLPTFRLSLRDVKRDAARAVVGKVPWYDAGDLPALHIPAIRREITAADFPGGPLFHPIGSEFFNHLSNGLILAHMGARVMVTDTIETILTHKPLSNLEEEITTFAVYRSTAACESFGRHLLEEWGIDYSGHNCIRIVDKTVGGATHSSYRPPSSAVIRARLLIAWASFVGWNRFVVSEIPRGDKVTSVGGVDDGWAPADPLAHVYTGDLSHDSAGVGFVEAIRQAEERCTTGACHVRLLLDPDATPLKMNPNRFKRAAVAAGRLVPVLPRTGSAVSCYSERSTPQDTVPLPYPGETCVAIRYPPFAVVEVAVTHPETVAVSSELFNASALVVTVARGQQQNVTYLWYYVRHDVTKEARDAAIAVFAMATRVGGVFGGEGTTSTSARVVSLCSTETDHLVHGRPSGWAEACTAGVHILGSARTGDEWAEDWHFLRWQWTTLDVAKFKNAVVRH
eukprot:Opistho-2@20896